MTYEQFQSDFPGLIKLNLIVTFNDGSSLLVVPGGFPFSEDGFKSSGMEIRPWSDIQSVRCSEP